MHRSNPVADTPYQGRMEMLVLTRKLGEKILIDNGLEIEVMAVNGSRVRLGFKAPESLRIMRSEKLSPEDAWFDSFAQQAVG